MIRKIFSRKTLFSKNSKPAPTPPPPAPEAVNNPEPAKEEAKETPIVCEAKEAPIVCEARSEETAPQVENIENVAPIISKAAQEVEIVVDSQTKEATVQIRPVDEEPRGSSGLRGNQGLVDLDGPSGSRPKPMPKGSAESHEDSELIRIASQNSVVALPIRMGIDKAIRHAFQSGSSFDAPPPPPPGLGGPESDGSSFEYSEEVCDCYSYLEEQPEAQTLAEAVIEIVESAESLKAAGQPPSKLSSSKQESPGGGHGENHSQDGIRTDSETFTAGDGEQKCTFVNTESLFRCSAEDEAEAEAAAASHELAPHPSACNSHYVFLDYDKFMGGDERARAAAQGEPPKLRLAEEPNESYYNYKDVVDLVKRTIEIENSLSNFQADDSGLLSIQCFDKAEYPDPLQAAEKNRCSDVRRKEIEDHKVVRSWEFKDEDCVTSVVIENNSEYIIIKRIAMEANDMAKTALRDKPINSKVSLARNTLTLDIFTDPLQNGAFRRFFASDVKETKSTKFLRAVKPEGSINMATFLETSLDP